MLCQNQKCEEYDFFQWHSLAGSSVWLKISLNKSSTYMWIFTYLDLAILNSCKHPGLKLTFKSSSIDEQIGK